LILVPFISDDYHCRDENINPKDGPLKKAGIRGPILVDPVYQKGDYSGRTPRPAPRVKPEAEEIANKSKGSVSKLFVTEDKRYNDYHTKTSKLLCMTQHYLFEKCSISQHFIHVKRLNCNLCLCVSSISRFSFR